jgi:signal peptidase I
VGAAGEADPLTAAPSRLTARRIAGIVLSVFVPGLGHVVAGRTRRGLAWLLLEAAAPPVTILGLVILEASGFEVRPALMLGLLLVALLFTLSLHVAAPLDLARLPAEPLPRLGRTLLALAVVGAAAIGLGLAEDAIGRVAFRSRYVQAFRQASGSMTPALLAGDRVLANRFVYRLREPLRGDVVVFAYPVDQQRAFLKRVIGLPGDDLYIDGRRIYVNCRPPAAGCEHIEDPWGYYDGKPTASGAGKFGPIRVPPGSYFVMGDNRDQSQDSRYWGFVKRDRVMGQAFLIYWSRDPELKGVRWERIGRWVQ